MKKKARIGMVLLLVSSLVLGGCVSQGTYDVVVTERDAAQAQVEALQADLATAQAEVKALQVDLATAQAEVETLQADLAAAQAELATAEAEVETLQADLATAQAEVEMLQADLAAVEAEVETLQTDLATAQAEVEALQADLATAQAELEALQTDYNSLEREHRQLQATHSQVVEDYEALRAKYDQPSPAALPVTIAVGNLDINLKEAYFAERIADFGPVGKFVVLTLEATNISRTDEYIVAYNFWLIGSERRLYETYDFGYYPPTGFVSGYEYITAEATLECKLAWDVPADEHDLYVLVTTEPEVELWNSVGLGL